MAVKVGINGFGRIGRTVLRIAAERPDEIELCGINLRKADLDYMVYLMKYDSVFGRFPGEIEESGNGIRINGHEVAVFGESNVADIPWDACGAEYIVESTGQFNTTELASGHLVHGAKKVVLSAPAKNTTRSITWFPTQAARPTALRRLQRSFMTLSALSKG